MESPLERSATGVGAGHIEGTEERILDRVERSHQHVPPDLLGEQLLHRDVPLAIERRVRELPVVDERVVVGEQARQRGPILGLEGDECAYACVEHRRVGRSFDRDVAGINLGNGVVDRVLVEVDHVYEAAGRVDLLELEETAGVAVGGSEGCAGQRQAIASYRDGYKRDVGEAGSEDGLDRGEILVAAIRSGHRHDRTAVVANEVVGDERANLIELSHPNEFDEPASAHVWRGSPPGGGGDRRVPRNLTRRSGRVRRAGRPPRNTRDVR